MRRRAFLRAAGAGALVPLAGAAAGHPGHYEPYGRVAVDGAAEAVVGPDGRTVYVAAMDGFAVVDVGSPTSPTVVTERRGLLADRDGGPMAGIQDAKVDGDRLAVAGPANPNPDVVSGFLLFDVSDPADPRQVAVVETDHAIHNVFFRDGFVYVVATRHAAMNDLLVYDARDDDPEPVGRWSLAEHDSAWDEPYSWLVGLHDVWVQDGTAYLAHWEAGTWLVDVTDPAAPTAVGSFGGVAPGTLAELDEREEYLRVGFQPPGNSHYVQPSADGSLLAVGREAWDVEADDGEGSPGGIDLWDVSDASAPTRLSHVAAPAAADESMDGTWTTSHNFELRDGYLATSWYQGGVRLYDVSDPARPVTLAWWRRPDEVAFWTARFVDDRTFVASTHAIRGRDLFEGLYAFPVAFGRQADPPSLTGDPPKTVAPTPTPTPTATPTDPPTATPTAPPDRTVPGLTPGLGAAGTVAALGVAAWRRFRAGDGGTRGGDGRPDAGDGRPDAGDGGTRAGEGRTRDDEDGTGNGGGEGGDGGGRDGAGGGEGGDGGSGDG